MYLLPAMLQQRPTPLVVRAAQVVLKRSLDLSRALNTVVGEVLRTGASVDNRTLPLVLRRLCEELGATYVKLGVNRLRPSRHAQCTCDYDYDRHWRVVGSNSVISF